MVRIEDLSFSFNGKPLYDHFHLEVPPGQVVLITGINGVGKSTLLRLMAGVLRPDGGTIRYDSRLGRDPRAGIGFISDKISQYESLTVARAIDLHCALFRIGEFDDALIRHTKIGRYQRLRELSVGQRTILQLSLILSQKPSLLLIDEVIHDLDAYLRKLFLDEIVRHLGEREMSVVMVNVNFHDIEGLLDRVVLLRHGTIAVDEPIERLKEKVKRVVSREELPGLPVLFERRDSDRRECFVYPFDPALVAGRECVVADLNLTEIVTAFIGGEYA